MKGSTIKRATRLFRAWLLDSGAVLGVIFHLVGFLGPAQSGVMRLLASCFAKYQPDG